MCSLLRLSLMRCFFHVLIFSAIPLIGNKNVTRGKTAKEANKWVIQGTDEC